MAKEGQHMKTILALLALLFVAACASNNPNPWSLPGHGSGQAAHLIPVNRTGNEHLGRLISSLPTTLVSRKDFEDAGFVGCQTPPQRGRKVFTLGVTNAVGVTVLRHFALYISCGNGGLTRFPVQGAFAYGRLPEMGTGWQLVEISDGVPHRIIFSTIDAVTLLLWWPEDYRFEDFVNVVHEAYQRAPFYNQAVFRALQVPPVQSIIPVGVRAP
jgi:hypothetical protein